ncbi:MAG: hypothetical protein BGN91_11230 [Nitrobacter sp. 62-13]|nr:MAG: hypothetical protein BGN91_11230 [Nitrobacter sp. 62-13]
MSALAYSFVTKSDIAVGFISFRFDAARPLDGIARQFPHNVFPVLIILALAYSTCLFLLHSDYLSASRWRDPTRSKYHYGDKMPPLPTWHYLAIVFFGSICLFYLHGLPELLRTYSGIKRLYSEPQLQAFFLVALLYVGLFQTLIVPISYSFINVVRDVLGRFA